jgi:hypothetical protein
MLTGALLISLGLGIPSAVILSKHCPSPFASLLGVGVSGVIVWLLFFSLASPIATVRQNALSRATDQATIARVAATDGASAVRRAAVERLTSEDALISVATSDVSSLVRRAAIQKVTDQASLAAVAGLDQDHGVRGAAVARLTADALSLAAEQQSDPNRRTFLLASADIVRAARAIPNQHRNRILADLMPLASRYADSVWLARFGALVNVTIEWRGDRRLYVGGPPIDGEAIIFAAEFARRSVPITARWSTAFPGSAPVEQIWHNARIRAADAFVPWLADDQDLLARLATSDADGDTRRAAVERLAEQSALYQVATADRDRDVRRAAVERLVDQSALAEIATTDPDRDVRDAAVEKLSDQSALVRVVMSSGYCKAQSQYVRTCDASARVAAVHKLTDQDALSRIATADGELLAVRLAAVKALTDDSLLAHVAATASDSSVRREAAWRLR